MISGTTGEQHSMTVEERMALFHKVKRSKNDLIIYGGVAAVQTNDAIALAITAEKVGLDGIMLDFHHIYELINKKHLTMSQRFVQ